MKILIAKHYWKNGENATWECHSKLDEGIFEYLKENYHNFVKERSNTIKKDGYFIYLCYEDGKDEHERDITNITFFVSKVKPKEISSLCSQNYENFELKAKSENHTRNLILMVLGIVIIFAIGFFGRTLVNNISFNTQQVAQPKEKDYNLFINSWNEQVRKLTEDENKHKTYHLARGNNTQLIAQLNDFVKPFYEDFNGSLDEYDKYKQGDIKQYTKYRLKNYIDKEIVFKESMSKDDIKNALKKITKERYMFEIVGEVLMMNDINIFLKKNKEQQ